MLPRPLGTPKPLRPLKPSGLLGPSGLLKLLILSVLLVQLKQSG